MRFSHPPAQSRMINAEALGNGIERNLGITVKNFLYCLCLEFVTVLHRSCPPFFKFQKINFFKLENSKIATTPLTYRDNQQLEEDCDLDEVQSDVENYVLETYNGDAHVARWQRVLNAFAGNDGGMSGVEARFMATLFSANRWEPVAEGIECLEAARGKDNTYAELIAKMYEWRYDTRWVSYKSHTNRWDRALLAFGESVSDSSLEPMSAADAQVFADRGWSRWVEVAKALGEIE